MISTPFSDRNPIEQQSQLLARLFPVVKPETCFALKGGTALNVYWFNFPRMSVDLDLVFLPCVSRTEFHRSTDRALARIQKRMGNIHPPVQVTCLPLPGSQATGKLWVKAGQVEVKIEVAAVHRESLYPPVLRNVQPRAVPLFGNTSLQLLSFAETCAGKFNAALTRQHPRDLFDVGIILESTQVTNDTRTAFVVNLLTQSRPLAHMLKPQIKNLEPGAIAVLEHMTFQSVRRAVLRDNLVALQDIMCQKMPTHHQEFLLSFTYGVPDWSLLEVPRAAQMPAIRWRMQRMSGLSTARRAELADWLYQIWPDLKSRYTYIQERTGLNPDDNDESRKAEATC